MAGVFSGLYNITPAHRAEIPSLIGVTIDPQAGGTTTHVGSALDMQNGAFLNRTGFNSAACPNTVIEQVRRCGLLVQLSCDPRA
jgi:hypothetical protein